MSAPTDRRPGTAAAALVPPAILLGQPAVETAAAAPVPVAAPVRLVNIANVLTVLRLLLVPVFLVLLLGSTGSGGRVAAGVVFMLAAATDQADGQLARRRGLVTTFGIVADPIADKALMGAALVGLAARSELPWWVVVVVLGRELSVTVLRLAVLRYGVMPASRGGKLKTLLQMLAIVAYLLPLSGPVATGRAALMAAALVVTVVTGLDYVLRAARLRRAALAGPAA